MTEENKMCEAQWDLENNAPDNPAGYRYTPKEHDPPVPAVALAVVGTGRTETRIPVCRDHANYARRHLLQGLKNATPGGWRLESLTASENTAARSVTGGK